MHSNKCGAKEKWSRKTYGFIGRPVRTSPSHQLFTEPPSASPVPFANWQSGTPPILRSRGSLSCFRCVRFFSSPWSTGMKKRCHEKQKHLQSFGSKDKAQLSQVIILILGVPQKSLAIRPRPLWTWPSLLQALDEPHQTTALSTVNCIHSVNARLPQAKTSLSSR